MRSFLFVVLIVVAAVLGFYYFWTPTPTVVLTPDTGPIAARRELSVKLDAHGAIMKKLTVSAIQGEKTVNVLVKEYPSASHQAAETFNLAQAGLQEGPFKLQVKATDSAVRFSADRTTTHASSFTLDNKPPLVVILSPTHNISRGGAGLVVYTVSKEVEKSGVVFGNQFFPGYRQKEGFYACLFPFPYDMDLNQYVPRVTAVDRAGNERLVSINYHLIAKTFPTDRINLSDSFLEKIAAEFKDQFPQAPTNLEIFLKVNNELRQQDRKAIYDFGRQTSPAPLWQGDFLRMPKAAPLGGFAQFRTYLYQGEMVDQQTHLGFDLASVALAPVPAANHGKVVYAGDRGLYGQCVVIDHGLGLQTLYGHLSRIGVKTGDSVKKGQIIGDSGSTGMAAGDHLHYEVIVSGQSVNPIEWWDQSWINNNVTSKLEIGKTLSSK